MNRWIWAILVAAVVVLAVGIFALWPLRHGRTLRLPGVVEVQEVRLGSKVGGRVLAVRVAEGETVYKPGHPLVEFEAPELENQKVQLQAKLASAKAEFARTKYSAPHEIATAKALLDAAEARMNRVAFGWRVEEKKQAESELESARADFDQAMKDWIRISGLYQRQAVSRTEYDAAVAYRDRAKGAKDAAEAKFKMMKAGSREEDKAESRAEYQRTLAQYEMLKVSKPEEIRMAEAKVAELEATLRSIEIDLEETVVRVPPKLGKAVIEVIAIRPGDIVAKNQPVVRVLRTDDIWVKVFVPETQYGFVTLDKKVKVTIDTHPGLYLDGVVVQRSNISEFTPRNIQSVDERRHQVFGVKIRVDDTRGVLNAGMAAEVTIPLD